MRFPGFSASSSLYRTSSHYRVAAGGTNDPATMGVPPLTVSPVPSSLQVKPIGPFQFPSCQPCLLYESGECLQYCVHCPGPYPDERCWVSFTPCAASECCPTVQSTCYVSGKSQFCCPPGQSCCDPETNLCAGVVADPFDCGLGGLTSNSNYFLANNCQPITGLTVALTATEDIVSSSGFTVQLNADSPQGVDAVQQYVFYITGNSITGAICNWQNSWTAIVCGDFGVPSANDPSTTVSTPISNGIPNGYTLQITLQYIGTSVSGALFEVLSDGQLLGTLPLPVSQTGCGFGLPSCPASPYCCTGYQSSADLSPITAFQVNIVGPGGGASTTFTQGAGNIEYSVSSGSLTPLSYAPACVETNLCTEETSNATYGQLLGCSEQFITQSFSP
jgi:hypothetical protein